MKSYSLLLSMIFLLAACSTHHLTRQEQKEIQWLLDIHARPAYQFRNYKFSAKIPVYERIVEPEQWMLDNLELIDEKKYEGRPPTEQERALLTNYISLLPPLHQKVIQERLMRIYIIDEFRGGGLTDWVPDRKGEFYGYMVLNSALFDKDITEWQSMRDNQALITDKENFVEFSMPSEYRALLYLLTHEATHLVDYVERINPFLDSSVYYYDKYIRGFTDWKSSPFSRKEWVGSAKTRPEYDFPERKDISTYDFHPAVLDIDDAERLWKLVLDGPFATLYGTKMWAEDLAEFVTLYHLETVMGIPLTVKIYKKGRLSSTWRPMDTPVKKKRKDYVKKVFY